MSTTLERPASLQRSFPDLCPVTEAIESLAEAEGEKRGAVSTRREVVDFILDLAGYSTDKPLHRMRLLEPSFGDGEFLLCSINRLLAAWKADPEHGVDPVAELAGSVCGVEIHRKTFLSTRLAVIEELISGGIDNVSALALADAWLMRGDFLLLDVPDAFDFVVGNPPYVRQESIHPALMAEYRARYQTVYDRADLYIPFIERSLNLLVKGGHLGFICADRWMKNRYGGPLRDFVAMRFHLKVYVDMVGTPAFGSDVVAYPAITLIAREKGSITRIAHRPVVGAETLARLAHLLRIDTLPDGESDVRELTSVVAGAAPWLLGSSDHLNLIRRLENELPTIEQAGNKVGIGVATGADKAFIGEYESLDVEPDRKLPLVMTRDIMGGTVEWRGLGVVNPFVEDGGLVDLQCYPRLNKYLEARKGDIARRHIAQKLPASWYRTIDRIYPALAATPKLLIPDIKGEAHIVYEDGHLYPHHNLYFITSADWDLRALRAVLRSGIARLFVSTYSTRMRGGYLRFQAQYLRRIRVPYWKDVPATIRAQLTAAAQQGDTHACNEAVFDLYRLSTEERSALGANGN